MPAIPFHCSVAVHTRAKGHSATAAAAYRSGSQITDERTGEVHDYTRRAGVEHAEIVTPKDAPEWASDRAKLWNAAELSERNKDGSDRTNARVCREMKVALPSQLDAADRVAILRDISRELAERHGVAVDFAMHAPDKDGDQRNHHGHIMFSTRQLGPDGFGKKTRELDDRTSGPKIIEEWRGRVAELCADKLLERGHVIEAGRWRHGHMTKQQQADKAMERGDTDYAREVMREAPTVHLGPAATAMERRGEKTALGDVNREVQAEGITFDNERAEMAEKIAANPAIVLENITRTTAVFDRRDMARELNRYIDDPQQFTAIMTKLEAAPELVQMQPEQRDGRRAIPAKYSTREMIETERGMIGSAQTLAESKTHGLRRETIERATGKYDTLSDEQRAAVEGVTGAGRLHVIIGDAGTGKSFAMRVAKEAWEAEGYRVRGCALAGKAADELEAGSGIKSQTIHSLEAAWDREAMQAQALRRGGGRESWKNGDKLTLTNRDILVIDEAGMVGSRQLGRVLAAAEKAGAKVVMLGDDKQLAAIEAGAGFRAITERVGASEITQIRRQKEDWAREASSEFARGDVRKALDAYNERGHVRIADTREAAKTRLAADWLADREPGKSSIILAHTNADVRGLNELIHDTRNAAGELGASTEFQTERGKREFAEGDRVVFLKNSRELGTKNGTLGTVEKAEDGRLSVKLDNGKVVEFSADQCKDIDHGYAVTIHKSQGVTVDRAYVLATGGMDRNLAYVGMTRHREAATLYAGADDFGSFDKLARGLARQRPKETTLDFPEALHGFAERRDFDGAAVVRQWVERGREVVAGLADRAEKALGRVLEAAGVRRDVPAVETATPEQIAALRTPQARSESKPPLGFVRREYSDSDLIGEPEVQPAERSRAFDAQNVKVLVGIEAPQEAMTSPEPGQARQSVIDQIREAQPERTRLADTVRAEFDGQPLDAVKGAVEAHAGVLHRARTDYQAVHGPVERQEADLRQARAQIETWSKRRDDAAERAAAWDKAHPVRVMLGRSAPEREQWVKQYDQAGEEIESWGRIAQRHREDVQAGKAHPAYEQTARDLAAAEQRGKALDALQSERREEFGKLANIPGTPEHAEQQQRQAKALEQISGRQTREQKERSHDRGHGR